MTEALFADENYLTFCSIVGADIDNSRAQKVYLSRAPSLEAAVSAYLDGETGETPSTRSRPRSHDSQQPRQKRPRIENGDADDEDRSSESSGDDDGGDDEDDEDIIDLGSSQEDSSEADDQDDDDDEDHGRRSRRKKIGHKRDRQGRKRGARQSQRSSRRSYHSSSSDDDRDGKNDDEGMGHRPPQRAAANQAKDRNKQIADRFVVSDSDEETHLEAIRVATSGRGTTHPTQRNTSGTVGGNNISGGGVVGNSGLNRSASSVAQAQAGVSISTIAASNDIDEASKAMIAELLAEDDAWNAASAIASGSPGGPVEEGNDSDVVYDEYDEEGYRRPIPIKVEALIGPNSRPARSFPSVSGGASGSTNTSVPSATAHPLSHIQNGTGHSLLSGINTIPSSSLASFPPRALPTNPAAGIAMMFAPPMDIITPGSLDEAGHRATSLRRWLLINVQSRTAFPCHALNRDVWSAPIVKELVREWFVFQQHFEGSTEVSMLRTLYHVHTSPTILVLDPVTGQKMLHIDPERHYHSISVAGNPLPVLTGDMSRNAHLQKLSMQYVLKSLTDFVNTQPKISVAVTAIEAAKKKGPGDDEGDIEVVKETRKMYIPKGMEGNQIVLDDDEDDNDDGKRSNDKEKTDIVPIDRVAEVKAKIDKILRGREHGDLNDDEALEVAILQNTIDNEAEGTEEKADNINLDKSGGKREEDITTIKKESESSEEEKETNNRRPSHGTSSTEDVQVGEKRFSFASAYNTAQSNDSQSTESTPSSTLESTPSKQDQGETSLPVNEDQVIAVDNTSINKTGNEAVSTNGQTVSRVPVPDEPSAGPSASRLMLLIGSKRIQRLFNKTDTLSHLYSFAIQIAREQGVIPKDGSEDERVRVFTRMPKELIPDEIAVTLAEANLVNCVVIIETNV